MKKKSFKRFYNSMMPTEFNNFCKKMAKEYVKYEDQYARTYFTEEYGITSDCFYKCLYYAVTNNLVDDKTVFLMRDKATRNSNAKSKENAGASSVRSVIKYNELMKIRNENIIFAYSNEQIRELAEYFANNPEISKQECADKYDISVMIFAKLLEKAIIREGIISDDTFYKIRFRSLKGNPSEKAIEYFDCCEAKRNSFKETAR